MSKNLVIMVGAMAAMRKIDQDDPQVLMYTRGFFAAYVIAALFINALLHFRVLAAKDMTKISVPAQKNPFAPPPAATEGQDGEGNEEPPAREMTIMAYDLETLATARKGWMFNLVVLTLIHHRNETVSPLLMSGIMGLVRFTDDPLFKLHVMGMPSVGPLKRPFKPEQNPLAGMLKGMLPTPPGDDDAAGVGSSTAPSTNGRPTRTNTGGVPEPAEDLHVDPNDDDDDDDDDGGAPPLEQEDPDDNDFDDDEPSESRKSK